MISRFLLSLAILVTTLGYCQTIHFEVPVSVHAQLGQELVVQLKVEGLGKYHIRMENNPSTSKILDNQFSWTPKADERNYYLVKFKLLDSMKVIVSESNLAIEVSRSGLEPYLHFDPELPDTIKVVEGEPFLFSATVRSRQGSAPQSVIAYYMFNENENVRSFDSCRITRMGDQLLFFWVPTNSEARKRYAKLRVTLVDVDKSIGSRTLNFKIQNVNRAPRFTTDPPDTVFLSSNQELVINYSATDPDNDRLKFDCSPKNPVYEIRGSQLIFKPISQEAISRIQFPMNLSITVSDGDLTLKRRLCVLKNQRYNQPTIGDFTRKAFEEGDSIVTYLNISNNNDPQKLEVKFTDFALPQGIGDLASLLVFDKKASYIRVHSKGIVPYFLVDRDYTYNIAVTISSKDGNWEPSFKVLELTIEDKPDPSSLGHQKDTLLTNMERFVKAESGYKSNLQKLYRRISRPWWKKLAVVTGTLSGVLVLIQSQEQNRTVSTVSAGISLLSIMVTNIPSLSEKELSELNDNISNSKSRIERMQEKESEFKTTMSFDIDQSAFNKIKSEIQSLLAKSQIKRSEDICSILANKKLKKRIDQMIKQRGAKVDPITDPEMIFRCAVKQ